MTTPSHPPQSPAKPSTASRQFHRELGLFDSAMIVMGVMIGSGIFIVPASMARTIGSIGWLLVAWILAGVLTVAAAVSYGELSSMMPKSGGMYLYLREAYSPLWGFLYGWTFFTVIQTGTIAAVAVAFARFTGILFPSISESNYIIRPLHLSAHYAVSLSTTQLLALAVIVVLTATNMQGVKYGKWVQNLFTVTKIGALLALIVLGFTVGRNHAVISANLSHLWGTVPNASTPLAATSLLGIIVVVCVAQSGSLFAADSWHNVTFASEEVRAPRSTLPKALVLGSALVIGLYLLANLAYLSVLSFPEIQNASRDRVATAMLEKIFPGWGAGIMAVAIMISTFGCINSLVLSGARAYYAMARDKLFFPAASRLNRAGVPGASLVMQAVWASLLLMVNTYSPGLGYGNIYSDLLDYIISAALLFYILTIAGVMVLRRKRPDVERPYRTFGYPAVPILYIVGATAIVVCLFLYRPATTWPGLVIVLTGIPAYWLFNRKLGSRSGIAMESAAEPLVRE